MPDPDRIPSTRPPSGDPDEIASAVSGDTLPGPNQPPLSNAGPRRLGRYRVLQRLGTGGMGGVYLAFDEGLRRRAAVKVMLPKFAADPSARERFLREARTCARVRSEHVVTIYDVGEDGVPFIAMEYLQGYPLDEYLKRHDRRLSVAQVMRVGREAAEGLAAAHALGLVHRDIKPGNLWLEAPAGRVKLLDFGLAKPVSPDDSDGEEAQLTRTGAVLGTPAYMSPEQARGEKVDHRTDLFSLGAVLYRLCTGRLPFQGPTAMAILTALATETPPAVRALNPDVPPALADLVHRLLAKDAAHRPASAAEVAKELARVERRVAAGEADGDDAVPMATAVADEPQVVYVPIQVTGYEPSAFAGLDDPSSVVEGLERTPKPAPPRRDGGGWGVWAAAAASVLLVGVVGAVVWRKIPRSNPVPPEVVRDDGKKKTVGKKDGKADPPPPPDPVPDPPFFNGKDLAGWAGDLKQWSAANGVLVGRKGAGPPSVIRTERAYRDFALSFQVRRPAGSGLGDLVVWFRSAEDGKKAGGELHLTNTRIGTSGSPVWAPVRGNEFNDVSIRCEGRRVTVVANGVTIGSEDADLPAEGVFVLRNNVSNGDVELRNVRFADLGRPAEPPPLDTKGPAGWKYDPKVWKVENGEFVGAVPAGPDAKFSYLQTDRNYRDFDLSFRYRVAPADEVVSVMIRGVGRCDLGKNKTGVLWMSDLELSPASVEAGKTVEAKKADEYSDVRVRCVGPRVTVTVNGVVAVEKDVPAWTDGAVGWRIVPKMTELRIRDVWLSDLSKPVGAAGPWRPVFATTDGELKPTFDPDGTARFVWEKRDGEPVLVATGGGTAPLAGRAVKDFHLRLQYRWPAADDSGLAVGYFRSGPQAFAYEVAGNGRARLYAVNNPDYWADPARVWNGQVEPVANAPAVPISRTGRGLRAGNPKPDDAWHTLELVCLGDTAVHRLDGVTLGAFANCRVGEKPDPAGRRDSGTLTLTVSRKTVEVRRAEIRDITALPPEWFAADVLASPDWEWAKIENLGDAVNGPGEEKEPTVSGDGLRLVFSRAQHLYEAARRSVDEPFAAPRRLDELVVPDPVGLPSLSADGLSLLLVVQPTGEPRAIWMSKRADRSSPWGKPERLGDAVNTKAGADDPALSADGLSLFFARTREGNGRDLWVSRRAGADAPWGEPEWLGPDVNTDGDERRPWPLADGGGFTFSRLKDGVWRWLLATPKSGGGWDVRVIRDRAWYSQAFAADGRVVVVSSTDIPGGRGGHDLWQIRRVPTAKPEPK
ncbi:MAG: hypothetical protein C0501_29520 [Isosphaera sp.]|nr:hypothetical protein [Isosphaera sp.]